MVLGQHLILQEAILPPAAEQLPAFEGWLVARVAQGLGYWLQAGQSSTQLNPGDGFVAAQNSTGKLRTSQLNALKLQYFTVQPHDLEGLLTVVEWHRIELALRQPGTAIRLFKSTDAIGQKFSRITSLSHAEQLPLRCALLQLWAAATSELTAEVSTPLHEGNKLRSRFWQLLSRMTRMELCFSVPLDLARRINCSERHFRGLFRKEFGVSMHAHQSKLRQNFDQAWPRISPSKAARLLRSPRGVKTNRNFVDPSTLENQNGHVVNSVPGPRRRRSTIRKTSLPVSELTVKSDS